MFPDVTDVFDVLVSEDKLETKRDVIDECVRSKSIYAVQKSMDFTVELPSAADLSEYVEAYWVNIHPHMPIFFKPAFSPSVVAEGILLAICALGALTMNMDQDAVKIISYAEAVIEQRRESGYCSLSDVQAMLLLELFELYHRRDPSLDPSRGLSDLVTAARDVGLCDEISNDFDDLSFDPDAEWRAWGNNEERRRYSLVIFNTDLERCLLSISSRPYYTPSQGQISLSILKLS